jgi:predicted Zn-dependent protease
MIAMQPRLLSIGLCASVLLIASCQPVPVTGRKQLHLVPSSQLQSMSYKQYAEFLSKNEVITNTPEAQSVTEVGTRIEQAVERFAADNKFSDRLKGYQWEFRLIKDTLVNAWCMPGGKVAVYSALLPVAQDDNGLAVVMGHEIAHAVAAHGDERMSQGLLVELGGLTLSEALSQKPEFTRQLFLSAYGLGTQVGVLLPYSRLQESEADRLGLIFMAMAGYDPHGAIAFWQRMMASQKGGRPPEFLSTHPSDEKRIKNIEKLIPEAMKYYQPRS